MFNFWVWIMVTLFHIQYTLFHGFINRSWCLWCWIPPVPPPWKHLIQRGGSYIQEMTHRVPIKLPWAEGGIREHVWEHICRDCDQRSLQTSNYTQISWLFVIFLAEMTPFSDHSQSGGLTQNIQLKKVCSCPSTFPFLHIYLQCMSLLSCFATSGHRLRDADWSSKYAWAPEARVG